LLNTGLKPENLISTSIKRGILDIVPLGQIQSALELLQSLGLVHENQVTTDGELVNRMPLSIRNSTLVLKWLKSDYPAYPGIVAATMIDSYGPSYFYYPDKLPGMSNDDYNTRVFEFKKHHYSRFQGFSDVDTFLNIWLAFISSVGFEANNRTITMWCKKNKINTRVWLDMKQTVDAMVKFAIGAKFNVEAGGFTVTNVTDALKPLAAEVYSNLIMRRIKSSQPTYILPKDKQRYFLEQRQTVNNFSSNYPDFIIPLVAIDGRGRKPGIVNVALDYQSSESEPKAEADINTPDTVLSTFTTPNVAVPTSPSMMPNVSVPQTPISPEVTPMFNAPIIPSVTAPTLSEVTPMFTVSTVPSVTAPTSPKVTPMFAVPSVAPSTPSTFTPATPTTFTPATPSTFTPATPSMFTPSTPATPATFTPATFTPATFTPATFTPSTSSTFTPATFTPATFTPSNFVPPNFSSQ
jgi:hypothetical protein